MIKNTTITTLPIFEIRDRFIDSVRNTNRIIVKAPTGSGKSTQIPQFLNSIKELQGRILVLEPRRIAAKMVALRVAHEMGEELGKHVGFITRFEQAVSSGTKIIFITEGILPRKLLADPVLKDVSAVVFDEFHERSVTTDVGLALVKRVQIESNSDIRIVVMSATLDTGPLLDYLPDAVVVESAGAMYPVEVTYNHFPVTSPPWEAALSGVRTVLRKTDSGDILIFMPGAYEIRKTIEQIKSASLGESLAVMPLYGDLPFELQQKAMETTQHRKIIVATNIAETSLTIPGIRHVIDSGLARVNRFDSAKGFNMLYTESISQASADQRKGRAGREAEGLCVRMWSQASHNDRARLTEPEISRVDLADIILLLHMLGIRNPEMFDWFMPPPISALNASISLLRNLGAIDNGGCVTEKGRIIASVPAHPRLAVLLLESALRGAAKKGAFAVALLSERNPLSGKPDIHDLADIKSAHSDFEWIESLIDRAEKADYSGEICTRLSINRTVVRQIKKTESYYLDVLDRVGVDFPADSGVGESLSRAILAAYPDRLARFRDNGTLQYVFAGGKSGELSPQSAARGAKFIVAGDIRETRFRGQATIKTVLSMAVAIEEEWLLEMFPDSFESTTHVDWNNVRMAVERRVETRCLGVVIENIVAGEPETDEAAAILSAIICDKNLKLESWDDECERLVNRVNFVASLFPDICLPDWKTESRKKIVRVLCEGEKRYSDVKSKQILPVIKSIIGSNNPLIDKLAPPFITLPNGRKMVINYEQGKAPFGRARIQDLYELKNLPVIAEGKVKMILEILAPNQRAVQVTDDITGFWNNHYPELKKTLSRRYPKHEWR